jgi:hypothetical protein
MPSSANQYRLLHAIGNQITVGLFHNRYTIAMYGTDHRLKVASMNSGGNSRLCSGDFKLGLPSPSGAIEKE